MKVLDLFSGIGGFSLGLERAGMRTVAFCERDPYCQAVLRKHWPGLPIFDDIHAIDSDGLGRIGPVDLVCGGFPCQPFSHAGKQKAQEDDRHLWPEMLRVIALARPAWVVGENVAGLIPLALDAVLADLEASGYAGRALVIPACAVDARHRRDRVWIIARDTDRKGESVGAVDDREVAELFGVTAYANGSRLERRNGGSLQERGAEWSIVAGRPPVADAASMLREAFLRYEQDGTDDAAGRTWKPESGVGRVANGIPRRVDRLRCLGNAVVPQVVEEIGRAIMAADGDSDA